MEGYNLSVEGNGEDVTVAHGLWKSTAHTRYARFSMRQVCSIPAGMLGETSSYGPWQPYRAAASAVRDIDRGGTSRGSTSASAEPQDAPLALLPPAEGEPAAVASARRLLEGQRHLPPGHPAPDVAASAAVVRAQLVEQGAAAVPQPLAEAEAEALAAGEPEGSTVPSFAALAQTANSSGRGARLAKEARRLASDLADVLGSPAAARRR